MHGAEHRPAVALEPDQRPPHRQPGDEGPSPVDRIEHPDVLGVLTLAPVLLAEDAVIGMPLGDEPPHRRLRRPVGHRHRIEGAVAELVLDVEALAEIGQDRPSGDVGHLVEEGDEVVGMRVGGHRSSPSARGAARTVVPRRAPHCKSARLRPRRRRRRAAGRPHAVVNGASRSIRIYRTAPLDICASQYNLCCIAVGPGPPRGPSGAFPP